MGYVVERSERTGQPEPVAVEALSRGLDVFRPLAAAYAVWLAWQRHETMVRPWLAAVVLAVLMGWSLALLVYRRRTTTLVVIEVTLAVLGVLATVLVETPESIAAGQFTLPTIWAAGAVTGAGILHGARGGVIAAVVIAAADIVEVGSPTRTTFHNILLLFLLGGLIGFAVDLAREGLARYEQVVAERERLRERERLARAVHDGVLQTLGLIHRRGEQLGGGAGELAVLAADQERSLRRLIARADAAPLREGPGAEREADLRAMLIARDADDVTVSAPAAPVVLDAHGARELDAAVAEALDNVARHAGPGAQAWVLLEDTAQEVVVTVRDDGVGCELADLLAAAERGRLGVAQSIRGRVADLGGHVEISARPGVGCRVTMTLPRKAPR